MWKTLALSSVLLMSSVFGDDVINCTYSPKMGKPIEISVINECDYNLKVRTCNADACTSTGGDERKYIDCPQHVDHKTNASIVVDQDVHFLVFVNTASGSETKEVWTPIPDKISFCTTS